MTPLTLFLLFFQVNLGPKPMKNRENRSQSRKFFDQVLGSIFEGFLMDFGAILGAKMEPKSMKKGVGKMMKKR